MSCIDDAMRKELERNGIEISERWTPIIIDGSRMNGSAVLTIRLVETTFVDQTIRDGEAAGLDMTEIRKANDEH